MENVYSYADVLESYMIAEEADSSKPMTKAEKIKAGLVLTGLAAGTAWVIHDSKKSKEKMKQREKEQKDREAEYKRKKDEEYAKYYHFNINTNKALEECRLDLSEYPEDKFKNNKDFLNSVERDLKSALPRILSTNEVTSAIKKMCDEYNNMPNDENKKERFYFMDAFPNKISINSIKSKFRIRHFEGSEPGDIIFEVSGYDQEFNVAVAYDIITILGKYYESKYGHGFSQGDGDEGCLYI